MLERGECGYNYVCENAPVFPLPQFFKRKLEGHRARERRDLGESRVRGRQRDRERESERERWREREGGDGGRGRGRER